MNIKNVVYWHDCRTRNDGPPLFLCTATRRNMQELGLEKVDHYLPQGEPKRYGTYDLNIWVDFGEDALGQERWTCPKPNVYWASDTHLGYDYRLDKAKEFDFVFVAQKDCVEQFKKDGISNVLWLPHAGEPTCYKTDWTENNEVEMKIIDTNLRKEFGAKVIKKYDVCFIGHSNCIERIDHLDMLFKEFPNFFWGRRFFEATASIFTQSKIVFNYAIKNDINMRVFETCLTGSLLLTNWFDNGFEDLGFKDGENVVFYKSKDEMIDKAKYYIEHDEERELIAQAGRQLVLNNHTYLHRISTILKEVRSRG